MSIARFLAVQVTQAGAGFFRDRDVIETPVFPFHREAGGLLEKKVGEVAPAEQRRVIVERHGRADLAKGTVKDTVVPFPISESTWICPPMASITFRHSAKPRPAPGTCPVKWFST